MFCHEIGVQVFQYKEFTRHIHHGSLLAFLGDEYHAGDTRFLGDERIVRTKSRRNMHNTRTLLGRHIVARNHAERIAVGFCPRNQLFVFHADQVCPLAAPEYLGGFAQLFAIGRYTRLCQQVEGGNLRVRVLPAHHHIVDFRTHAQGSVAWQCPWRRRPCERIQVECRELSA